MKRIDYSKLYRGNVIVMPVNSKISTEKNPAVVTGIVSSISNNKIILANYADDRSFLDDKLTYSRHQINKNGFSSMDNIRLVLKSLGDRTPCYDDTPNIGDLILMNGHGAEYYLGFVNNINGEGLLLSNYHPEFRIPWIHKNSQTMDTSYSYIKLIANDDIKFDFSK